MSAGSYPSKTIRKILTNFGRNIYLCWLMPSIIFIVFLFWDYNFQNREQGVLAEIIFKLQSCCPEIVLILIPFCPWCYDLEQYLISATCWSENRIEHWYYIEILSLLILSLSISNFRVINTCTCISVSTGIRIPIPINRSF